MSAPGGSAPRPGPGRPSEAELLAARRIVSGAERRALDEAEALLQQAQRVSDAASIEAQRLVAEATETATGTQDEPRQRRQAALAAAEPGVDDVVGLLGMLREDLSPEGRVAAVEALARASVEVQLEALGVALADPDAGVRTGGLELLPAAGSTRALVRVLGGAEDEDQVVRAAAYRRLAGGSSWVRWVALGRCSQRDELLVVLAEEDAEGLAGMVVERLGSPEVADRVLAVEVAGSLGSPGLLAEVVGALGDGEAVVRRAAAGRLAGWDGAVRGLAVTLGDDPDVGVRVAAGRALVGGGGEVVLTAFVERLADPAVEVRAVAVEALVGCPSAELAGRLAGSLTAASVDSVGAVLVGMGAAGEQALEGVVVDGPAERAAVAAELLATLDGDGRSDR